MPKAASCRSGARGPHGTELDASEFGRGWALTGLQIVDAVKRRVGDLGRRAREEIIVELAIGRT